MTDLTPTQKSLLAELFKGFRGNARHQRGLPSNLQGDGLP